jgi:acyl-CoA thioester hydrolase
MLEYRDTVRDDWIDYNGHLSEPFYVMVFGFATTAMMHDAKIDLTAGYSLYTVEAHIRYLREVSPLAELLVTTNVIEVGARKLRFCHEMYVGDLLVATEELLGVHVRDGATCPFPEHVADQLRQHLTATPDYAGRAIS